MWQSKLSIEKMSLSKKKQWKGKGCEWESVTQEGKGKDAVWLNFVTPIRCLVHKAMSPNLLSSDLLIISLMAWSTFTVMVNKK